jgi:hypothetical protein
MSIAKLLCLSHFVYVLSGERQVPCDCKENIGIILGWISTILPRHLNHTSNLLEKSYSQALFCIYWIRCTGMGLGNLCCYLAPKVILTLPCFGQTMDSVLVVHLLFVNSSKSEFQSQICLVHVTHSSSLNWLILKRGTVPSTAWFICPLPGLAGQQQMFTPVRGAHHIWW